MKLTSILAFLLLTSAFVLSPGCACPRRKAETTRSVEWFTGRDDGLVRRETWRDAEGGGGLFLFTDPAVQQMFALHTNQTALGGGSLFSAGTATITVDTNTAAVVGATGTAAGNVIGAAMK
ncbi:MAG: hypothetical protein ABSH38_08775 [Verrucomicrobiota bacterium]|jgi:hypothetical protein